MRLPPRPDLAARIRRLLPLLTVAVAGALFVTLLGGPQQALAELGARRDWLIGWIDRHPLLAPVVYVLCYAGLITLMWIPAIVCTFCGGFLFGFWEGAALSLTGATAGAVNVFLMARHGLGGLTRHAGPYVQRFEAGFRADALSYLLVLRLIPLLPFVVVTVAPALLGVSLRVFVFATTLGIVPSTLIYAGLGNGLREMTAQIDDIDGAALLQPGLLLALFGLALLSLTPMAWRRWRAFRDRR